MQSHSSSPTKTKWIDIQDASSECERDDRESATSRDNEETGSTKVECPMTPNHILPQNQNYGLRYFSSQPQQHVLNAWKWYESHGCPKYWVAPLVGLSDKSFRILCRRHGAHVCHTEMIDPGGLARSSYYQTQMLGVVLEKEDSGTDRPLVLQFGSSNVEKLLTAMGKAVATGKVDAIELNCGCPQRCAKKGRYGAFLLDSPQQETLLEILRIIRSSDVLPPEMPLLVKMRVLESVDETVDLARRIVQAGAGLLTVHGRTRHQGGGSKTSGKDYDRLASWPHIRAVKQAVDVPVVANGNVPNRRALSEILTVTGCDGVMSGVGILRDPTLFDLIGSDDEDCETVWNCDCNADNSWKRAVRVANEYIGLAIQYRTHPIRISQHLLWILDGRGFKSRTPAAREEVVQLRFLRYRQEDEGGNVDESNKNSIVEEAEISKEVARRMFLIDALKRISDELRNSFQYSNSGDL